MCRGRARQKFTTIEADFCYVMSSSGYDVIQRLRARNIYAMVIVCGLKTRTTKSRSIPFRRGRVAFIKTDGFLNEYPCGDVRAEVGPPLESAFRRRRRSERAAADAPAAAAAAVVPAPPRVKKSSAQGRIASGPNTNVFVS